MSRTKLPREVNFLSCQKVFLALKSPTKMKGFGSSEIKLFNCTGSNISFGFRNKEQMGFYPFFMLIYIVLSTGKPSDLRGGGGKGNFSIQ